MFRCRCHPLSLNVTTWIALAILGSILAWVEFGAMWFFGSSLPAYPCGWPFCHCVRLRASVRYDVNGLAMIANGMVCILLLVAMAFVLEQWHSYSGNRRQLRLTSWFAGMTVASVMFALLSRLKSLTSLTIWQEIGIVPRGLFPPSALTHWSISHPRLDWCLRLSILVAVTCAVYMAVSYAAHLTKAGIACLRRMRTQDLCDNERPTMNAR
jgi:hypothetical protein